MQSAELNGVLPMYKPQDFTSFDVIGKLRGILHMKKLGHTGTLDPNATGVLPILVGKAARACDIFPNQEKTYVAKVHFGETTTTEDIWGEVVETYPEMHVRQEDLEGIIPNFLGTITQIPPMYSAVKINGVRLYDLARKGLEVERPARQVEVHEIQLLNFSEEEQTAELKISCGKGTYIRTILTDMGRMLGGGAMMTELCRTAACGYTLEQCYTFEQVEQFMAEGSIREHLIPTESLFSMLPSIILDEKQGVMYKNGVKLDLKYLPMVQENQNRYTVYTQDEFLGLAKVDREEGVLRVEKNFFG